MIGWTAKGSSCLPRPTARRGRGRQDRPDSSSPSGRSRCSKSPFHPYSDTGRSRSPFHPTSRAESPIPAHAQLPAPRGPGLPQLSRLTTHGTSGVCNLILDLQGLVSGGIISSPHAVYANVTGWLSTPTGTSPPPQFRRRQARKPDAMCALRGPRPDASPVRKSETPDASFWPDTDRGRREHRHQRAREDECRREQRPPPARGPSAFHLWEHWPIAPEGSRRGAGRGLSARIARRQPGTM
jgi:hypothetical protein